MLELLDRHPHARAVLAPALPPAGSPSHAYLFHGPGGSGKRESARAFAAALLADGSPDRESACHRVATGAHPDLTWVVPGGAHEILVSDIDEPVVAAASRTPFESGRRVFVIERVDELGEEAANRMLKTLEEPPAYVHLILLTERLVDVLPTIRSRCQAVRFDAPAPERVAGELERLGIEGETALACARLALGDSGCAQELAGVGGQALREAAGSFAVAALQGATAERRTWTDLLVAARNRGAALAGELDGRKAADLELHPRKERKRVETEWNDRIRRGRRRLETRTLDLGLQLVSLWLTDLAMLQWGAPELVRNADRMSELRSQIGADPQRLRRAVTLVEETRQRFQLNVAEELACEALAYRLEQAVAT